MTAPRRDRFSFGLGLGNRRRSRFGLLGRAFLEEIRKMLMRRRERTSSDEDGEWCLEGAGAGVAVNLRLVGGPTRAVIGSPDWTGMDTMGTVCFALGGRTAGTTGETGGGGGSSGNESPTLKVPH
jgi:hypothetical protein